MGSPGRSIGKHYMVGKGRERFVVPRGDFTALRDEEIDVLDLRKAESGTHLVHAIVVPETVMVEPLHIGSAALITKRAAQLIDPCIVGSNHSAFARGHLFVRIKSKNR